MGLEEYRAKRDFSRTTEPGGRAAPEGGGQSRFVVQEHHASKLHYDFRLEIGGVLKSWAVPKGVPLQSGIRRLAVETEDHPLDYINFEGVIPEGEYGAGSVKIWDSGAYKLLKSDQKKMEFHLEGSRVNGEYALVKTGDKSWLLLKKKQR